MLSSVRFFKMLSVVISVMIGAVLILNWKGCNSIPDAEIPDAVKAYSADFFKRNGRYGMIVNIHEQFTVDQSSMRRESVSGTQQVTVVDFEFRTPCGLVKQLTAIITDCGSIDLSVDNATPCT